MTPGSTPPSMSSMADRYRRHAQRFSDLVAAVPAERWSAPSPCEDWTAADVVHHVVSTEADMLGRMPFAPPAADDLTDPVAAWPAVRDRIQAALDDPSTAGHAYDGYFGPTTFAQTIDTFYSFDLVVHAWDLARAAGLTEFEPIDAAEMVRIRTEMTALGQNLRQPGLVAEEVEVGPDADAQTSFLAFLGRRA